MFHRILVPLDGSARAESALPVAARIARASDGTLILLRVVPSNLDVSKFYIPEMYPIPGTDEELVEAREYLKTQAILNLLVGLKVETHALTGKVAPTILNALGEYQADLMILRGHGFHGLTQWAHGSIAHKLLHHSPVPLLILPEDEQDMLKEQQRPPHILVTLDGSHFSEAALKPAAELAATLAQDSAHQGQLQIFRVVDIPSSLSKFRSELTEAFDAEMRARAKQEDERYLATVARHFTEDELATYHLEVSEKVVIHVDVANAIVQTAEQDQVDVIAMATHGRGEIIRWALGSITERVLYATHKPLLLVRVQAS